VLFKRLQRRFYFFLKKEVVMAGISVWQLAIIAAIVVLLFGTKKLSRIGGDLGTSVKGFKRAMQDKPNDEA